MAAMLPTKNSQKIRFAILGKPASYNIKQPEAYRKAKESVIFAFGNYVR